jgi:hypothetical protein
MPTNKLEQIFDAIAEALIQSDYVNPATIKKNQKTIKNGFIQLVGTNAYDKLILFEKDVKANSRDFLGVTEEEGVLGNTLEEISNLISNDAWEISIPDGYNGTASDVGTPIILLTDGDDVYNLTPILYDNDQNPLNVSQFLNINKESQNIDSGLAEEFLDTSIFELLGDTTTRQERINNFFNEFQNLTGPIPEFGVENGLVSDDFSSDNYSEANDISFANDDPLTESSDKFITRLDSDNDDTENPNSNTLQSLRDRLNTYLVDIDQETPSTEDQRPTYRNKSDGYLKFRNLNQGIIIRNTNQEFIEGLNPSNLSYLDTLDDNNVITQTGTGFTITMWVRFLDKVSEGTLFNFGNPIRGVSNNGETVDDDAFGFRLETYVINKDDLCPKVEYDTWGDAAAALTNYNTDLFDNSNTARFVRLVVNDNGQLRDSTVGCNGDFQKLDTSISVLGSTDGRVDRLLTTTHIPEDFSEWYFICASFNPAILEDDSHYGTGDVGNTTLEQTPDYWLNHIVPTNDVAAEFSYTTNSGYGNKCKVEIISKSDLLRARGYKSS